MSKGTRVSRRSRGGYARGRTSGEGVAMNLHWDQVDRLVDADGWPRLWLEVLCTFFDASRRRTRVRPSRMRIEISGLPQPTNGEVRILLRDHGRSQ